MTPTNIAQLEEWAKAQGFDAEQLDTDIHDLFAKSASEANNGGMSAQLKVLCEQLGGIPATMDYLRETYCILLDAPVSFLRVKAKKAKTMRVVVHLDVKVELELPAVVDEQTMELQSYNALSEMDYHFGPTVKINGGQVVKVVGTEIVDFGDAKKA